MKLGPRQIGAILALVFVLSALLVPAASAAPAPVPAAGGPKHYTVQWGDTMYKIAARTGCSPWSIASANHITNLNKIYAGQVLVIPCGSSYGPCGWQPCPPPQPKPKPWPCYPYNQCPPPPPPPPPPPSPCYPYNQCPPPKPPPTFGPWTATYYNGYNSSDPTSPPGSAILTASYPVLNFNWGWGPPAPGLPNQNWSATYVNNQNLAAGTYRVQVTVDDGVAVYINGQSVINQWQIQSARTFTQDVYLSGGATNVTVYYFQAAGTATLCFNMWRIN